MMRGLWKLTWIEIKVFLREPMGAFGTIVFPVLIFLLVGRVVGGRMGPSSLAASGFIQVGLPIIVSLLIAVSAVLSPATLLLMVLAGKRYYPAGIHISLISFTIALLVGTLSILSIGFLIASIVPTARFAQPIGAAILYPMLGISGLFVPVALMPPMLRAMARVLPTTYAVSLLEGIWKGDAWSAHLGDVAALAVGFVICTAISAKIFRWE